MALEYYRCDKCKKDTFHRVVCEECAAQTGGTQPTASNSDLVQLLCDIKDYFYISDPILSESEKVFIMRIDAVLAQQH